MTAWLVPTARATALAADGRGGACPRRRVGARRRTPDAGRSACRRRGRGGGGRGRGRAAGPAAADLLSAVPTSAAVRRARRLALLVPVGVVVWLAYLWPAQALVPGWAGRSDRSCALTRPGWRSPPAAPRAGSPWASPYLWSGSPPPGPLEDSTTTSPSVLFAWQHHPWIVTVAAAGRTADRKRDDDEPDDRAVPGGQSPAGRRSGQLARIEARRMLRHPAPWIGLVLSGVVAAKRVDETSWASAHYEGLLAAIAPLLLGLSLASVSAFAREHVPVADEAPLEPHQPFAGPAARRAALVGLVASGRRRGGRLAAAARRAGTRRRARSHRARPLLAARAAAAGAARLLRRGPRCGRRPPGPAAPGGHDRAGPDVVPRRRRRTGCSRARSHDADAAAGPADPRGSGTATTPTRHASRPRGCSRRRASTRTSGDASSSRPRWRPGTTSTWSP